MTAQFPVGPHRPPDPARRPGVRRSSPTRVRPALHRPHGDRRVDAGPPAGTTRAVVPYGPFTARPGGGGAALRARRSSRGSRPTGTPTARLAVPARPTPRGSRRSARRLALPELPGEDFLAVAARSWSPPTTTGCRRRAASEPVPAAVHVRLRGRSWACGPPPRYRTAASPARPVPYFPGGVQPVVALDVARLHPGGPGAPARPSAAATTPRACARREAAEHGCDQVVFLDAASTLGRGAGRHERLLRATADGELSPRR